MKVIRLKIYQPQAHYRIPFTYRRRHTYPIPPYSTIIGFLCNVLGIDNQNKDEYKKLKEIKISIAGRFEYKSTEYVWFRNLSKNAHIDRFGHVGNRFISGHIEHIGGQSLVSIDILNNVWLIIYFAHENGDFLRKIKSNLENPVNRLEIIHLGRAEDWVVFEEISDIFDITKFSVQQFDINFKHFFWIPEKIWIQPEKIIDFHSFRGLSYRIPTFCEVEGFQKTYNRHGYRVFKYITVKLNEGVMLNSSFLYDKDIGLPIFLAEL